VHCLDEYEYIYDVMMVHRENLGGGGIVITSGGEDLENLLACTDWDHSCSIGNIIPGRGGRRGRGRRREERERECEGGEGRGERWGR